MSLSQHLPSAMRRLVVSVVALLSMHGVSDARITLVPPRSGPHSTHRAAASDAASHASPYDDAEACGPAWSLGHTRRATGTEIASADGAEIIYEGIPDTLTAFRVLQQKIHFRIGSHTLLWFEIRWRTEDGYDLLINEGYFDADDSITLPYPIPSARMRGCRFRAFMSTERSWATQVWTGETALIPIRPHRLSFDIDATPSRSTARVGDSLSIAVSVDWSPDSGEVFPYLFCDLISDGAPIYSRAIGYDVRRRVTTFVFPFHILERAAGRTLRARCYLTDGFDPDGPVLAEELSREIVIARFDSGASSRQRLALGRGGFYLDRMPVFLFGANLVSHWSRWDSATIVQQVANMADGGLNYVRLWWEWNRYEPEPGVFSSEFKSKIRLILRETERRGIFVEPVPVGNWGSWNFDLYRDHWWSDSVNRAAQYRYFYDVGRLLLESGARNIAYVSLMQEGSFSFDWYDPKIERPSWGTYPGPLASAQAEADWRDWLRINGRPTTWTYDSSFVEFGRWASERFNDLIALRRKALRDASGTEFRVGLEGSQGGYDYDRRIVWPAPAYYLKPERWCHLVDVAEIHNYIPNGFSGYWSYETGIAAYVKLMRRFDVVANVGEYQFSWAGTGSDAVNNDSLPWAWDQLRTKSEKMRDLDVAGCAIWAWADYDARRFGLEDITLRPRPILDSLSLWLATWMPQFKRDRVTISLWSQSGSVSNPRLENDGMIAATSRDEYADDPSRYRALSIPLLITHCHNEINGITFSGTYDSTMLEFVGVEMNGEFAAEPIGLGTGWRGTAMVDTAGGSKHRFTVSFWSWQPLRIANTPSVSCLLDTLPFAYLRFNVLRASQSNALVTLDPGAAMFANSDSLHFRLRLGGSDSASVDQTTRVPGKGRAAIRVYERPGLRPIPDTAFVAVTERDFVLRDTLTLPIGDARTRTIALTLRDTVHGSITPAVTVESDRPWAAPSASTLLAGYPMWRGIAPDDDSIAITFDPADALSRGDTSAREIVVTLDGPELRDATTITIPLRWTRPVAAPSEQHDRRTISIAPNPVRAGGILKITGDAAVTRPLCFIGADGRAHAAQVDSRGALAAPTTSGAYILRIDADGVVVHARIIVVP